MAKKQKTDRPRDSRGRFLSRSSCFGPEPWTDPVSGLDYMIDPDGRAVRYYGAGVRPWEKEVER